MQAIAFTYSGEPSFGLFDWGAAIVLPNVARANTVNMIDLIIQQWNDK
jgi:hypothetical protein